MGLIDYFRILKTIIILLLVYICTNNVPNQNGKAQEETLADSNSDAVKTTMRLCYFKMTLPLFKVLQKFLSIPLSLCHMQ